MEKVNLFENFFQTHRAYVLHYHKLIHADNSKTILYNGIPKVKIAQFIKWRIMHIFNEMELTCLNEPGKFMHIMSSLSLKAIREKDHFSSSKRQPTQEMHTLHA